MVAKVQQAFDKYMAKSLDSAAFAKQLAGFSGLLVADTLYSNCLGLLKSQTYSSAQPLFEAIDSLSQWRRQLLAGASLNAELYLQSWAINLIKASVV